MRREDMNRMIDTELAHIPRGEKGSPQNAFRMIYNADRRRDLGQRTDAPRHKALFQAVASVTSHYPSFSPDYDTMFFQREEGSYDTTTR